MDMTVNLVFVYQFTYETSTHVFHLIYLESNLEIFVQFKNWFYKI